MRNELNIEPKTSLSYFLQVVLRSLASWEDFFLHKHVRLSEAFLLWTITFRFLWEIGWMLLLGEQPTNLWVIVFGSIAIVHILSLFFAGFIFRGVLCVMHAVGWCGLMLYTIMVNPASTTVTINFSIMLLASLVAQNLLFNRQVDD